MKSLDFLDIKELTNLLLAPVFIGFALSMALMFFFILKTSLVPEQTPEQAIAAQAGISSLTGMECTVENGNQVCDLLWFLKITFSSVVVDLYWFILSLVGIAICWFLLFWAVKQTRIWKEIGGSLQDLGEKILMTTPIVPVGSSSIGMGALVNAPSKVLNTYKGTFNQRARDDLDLLTWSQADKQKIVNQRNAEAFLRGDEDKYGNLLTKYDVATFDQAKAAFSALQTASQNNVSYQTKVQALADKYITAIWTSAQNTDSIDKMNQILSTLWMSDVEKKKAHYQSLGLNGVAPIFEDWQNKTK